MMQVVFLTRSVERRQRLAFLAEKVYEHFSKSLRMVREPGMVCER